VNGGPSAGSITNLDSVAGSEKGRSGSESPDRMG
jgi:hypothetical protein